VASGNPNARIRQLAIELRRLRQAANLTVDQAAEALRVSSSKISRIELGQVTVSPRDVRAMLELYSVIDDERGAYFRMAQEARERPWWNAFSDLSTSALSAFEAEAALIQQYSPLLIPGLLQTPEYARAAIRALNLNLPSDDIEHRVQFRLARQLPVPGDALEQVDPPIPEPDPGAGHQIGHGPGDQHLARPGRSRHPGPDMDRNPGQILTNRLDLPGMQANPDLDPQGADRIPHRTRA
jgi:transcriptional regulator with XRE-family HTH domain